MLLRRSMFIVGLAALGAATSAGVGRWEQHGKLAVRNLSVLTKDSVCWKRLEFRFDLTGTFTTPFDADEIAVDALFRLPSGKSITVPAFFYQRHEKTSGPEGRPGTEVLKPVAAPEWRVRFMPTEAGAYTVR